jgi:HEAT repeat protein
MAWGAERAPAGGDVRRHAAVPKAPTDLTAEEQRAIAGLLRLAQAPDPEALGTILEHLDAPSPAVRTAAYHALCQSADPHAGEAIVEAWPDAPPRLKPMLARALGERRHADAAGLLTQAATSPDAVLAEEAVRALQQLGPAAASALPTVARDAETPAARSVALDAAIRLGHDLADRGQAEDALATFRALWPLAKTKSHRRSILRDLAKTGRLEAAELLLTTARSKDDPLRGQAVTALLGLADTVREDRREAAIRLYKQVIDLEPDAALADEAARKLHQLGVAYSPAARKGYITTWWLLGPFPCRDMRDARKPRPPERGTDLTRTYREGDRDLRWTLHHSLHPEGRIVCKDIFTPNDRVLIYAYTEVTAPREMPVRFLIRRDDGLTLWLNGEAVYDEHTPHGADQAEYRVDATLRKGTNRLLVKNSQGGGDWEFSVRMEK